MNENGIFQLEDVALNEDYIEEVKVPVYLSLIPRSNKSRSPLRSQKRES